MKTKKKQMRIERSLGSSMSGCNGTTWYYEIFGSDSNGHQGPDIEEMLGEELGTGSIVEISVRIIKKVEVPGYCENPWPSHADGCPEADSKRRLGG